MVVMLTRMKNRKKEEARKAKRTKTKKNSI